MIVKRIILLLAIFVVAVPCFAQSAPQWLIGSWEDAAGNLWTFNADGTFSGAGDLRSGSYVVIGDVIAFSVRLRRGITSVSFDMVISDDQRVIVFAITPHGKTWCS